MRVSVAPTSFFLSRTAACCTRAHRVLLLVLRHGVPHVRGGGGKKQSMWVRTRKRERELARSFHRPPSPPPKVAINTAMTELSEFLSYVVKHTNMCCLTPTSALGGKSTFLAANLYAKVSV